MQFPGKGKNLRAIEQHLGIDRVMELPPGGTDFQEGRADMRAVSIDLGLCSFSTTASNSRSISPTVATDSEVLATLDPRLLHARLAQMSYSAPSSVRTSPVAGLLSSMRWTDETIPRESLLAAEPKKHRSARRRVKELTEDELRSRVQNRCVLHCCGRSVIHSGH